MYSQTFSLVSYVEKHRLEMVLQRHSKQVLYYEMIKHDKDIITDRNGKAELDEEGKEQLKQEHIHCNIYLKNQQAEQNVAKWFDRLYDKQGNKINTLIQDTKSTQAEHDYLTHKKNPEKFQYDEKKIIYYFNEEFATSKKEAIKNYCGVRTKWSIKDVKERAEWEKDERARSIVEQTLEGAKSRDMLKAYGRDYVYNRKKYLEIAYDIAIEEQNTKMIARLKNQLRIYDPSDLSKMEAEIAHLTCQLEEAKEKYLCATGEDLPFSESDDFLGQPF